MAGAVETNEPSLPSAIDVLLVNCCVLYIPGERVLLSYLRSIGMGRWVGYGFRGKWGIIFALVGAVLPV